MGTQPDPFFTAVARIGDELSSITARLTRVTDDVADLREAMEAAQSVEQADTQTAPEAAPHESAPPQPESVTAAPDPARGPAPRLARGPALPPTAPAPRPQLQYATAGPPPPPQPQPFGPPAPAVPAPAGNGVTLGKILAFTGVAITLIGVVLLLVLAAQAGLLRPEVRVAGGALLAAALVGAGLRIGREAVKRTAAAALVATGIAAALFCVLAAVNIYHWLPVIAALVLTGLIAAGGFVVAGLWDSQALGVTVGIGLIAFAPFLTHGVTLTLVVFLLVYAAATLAVQFGRDWPVLFTVNTVATAAPLAVVAALADRAEATEFAVAASVCFLLAVGSAVALLRTSGIPVVVSLIGLIPLLPLVGGSTVLGATTTAILLGAAAALLALLTLLGPALPGADLGVRMVWLTGAVATTVVAIGVAGRANGLTLGLLAIALLLALASQYTEEMATTLRILATVALGIGLLALAGPGLIQLVDASALSTGRRVVVVIGALLAMAALAVLTRSWTQGRTDSDRNTFVVSASVVGLVLFNVLCVAVGALASGGSLTGFRAGHMCATIGFVVVGAVALLWARRLRGSSRTLVLTAGLIVLGVAVGKLFLFDLAALAGIFRVIAFIVVGLVLLGLGVAYAQSLNDDPDGPPSERVRPAGPPPAAGPAGPGSPFPAPGPAPFGAPQRR